MLSKFGAAMNLAHARILSKPVSLIFILAVSLLVFVGQGQAAPKAAVFDFELLHGSLVPGAPVHEDAERKRLAMISERLRDLIRRSGSLEVVNIAPVAAKAAAANLQACGNCADGFAETLGADYAVTGTVYKVSELILSMTVYVHESATSKRVADGRVDLRGNTDESWRRGIDYLYRNILAPRLKELTK